MALLVITLLAGFLRFWQLGSLPPVNRDELAIGYNAYSIVLTHHDEHGVGPWPVSFQSFGDYKLPGLIYSVAALLKALPLNDTTIRLPNALLGTLLIPLAYLLAKQLFSDKKIGLLAAGLLAISWWQIHASRSAYEPLIGLFFTQSALLSFLAIRKRIFWLIPALLAAMLALVSYNAPVLLLPLYEGACLILLWSHYASPLKKFTAALTAGSTLVLAYVSTRLTGGVTLSRTATTILGNPNTHHTIENWLLDLHTAGFSWTAARIFANKPLFALLDAAKGYVASISPSYLFFTGDANPWHNFHTLHLGNINPLLIIPLIYAAWYLMRHPKHITDTVRMLAVLTLLSPLADAITIDAPITNRLLDLHFYLNLWSAYGLYYFWQTHHSIIKRLWAAGFAASTGFFLLIYTIIYPAELNALWNPGAKALVQAIAPEAAAYRRIYITENFGLAYIYFAFYTPIPPDVFQKQTLWANKGLDYVAQFGPYEINDVSDPLKWSLKTTQEMFPTDTPILVVHDPGHLLLNKSPSIEIKDAQGRPQWVAEVLSPETILTYYQSQPKSVVPPTDVTTYLNHLKTK